MSKTVNNAFYYTLGSIIKAFVSFLLLPFFANILGATQYGVLSLLQTFSSVMAILMTFGIERSLYRLYYDYKGEKEQNCFLSTLFWSINATSMLIIILSFLCAGYLSEILGGVDAVQVIIPVIIYTFLQALINYTQIIMQVEQKGRPFLLISLLLLISYNVVTLVFLFFYGKTYQAMIYGNLFANMIVLPFAYIRIKNRIKFSFDFTILKSTFQFSFPLLLMALFAWTLNMSDRLFIANYADLKSLGLYSMGSKMVSLLIMFDSAIFQAYGPYFFNLANTKSKELAKHQIKTANDSITLVIGLIAIIMVLFSNLLFHTLFKPEYRGSLVYVYILLIGRVISQQTGLLNPMIYQNKKTKEISYITIGCAVTSVVLNRFLIPLYGPIMAGITNLIASILLFGLTYFIARKNYFIPLNFILLCGSVLIIVICYVVDVFVPNIFIALGLKIVMLLLVYYIAVYFQLQHISEIRIVIVKMIGPVLDKIRSI